ncbi:MAG TPA: hypothetical protein VEC58_00190, partial [Roseiarcus sp.]|nr:hypothetical protein [Roseiarcus sp.]
MISDSYDMTSPAAERSAAPSRLIATYRVRAKADSIEERARAIAIEQSVEAPLAAIRDARVRAEIVGEVVSIAERDDGN